jgi:dihydroorotase
MVRTEWMVPARLAFGAGEIVPMAAGETLPWKLQSPGAA